MTQIMDSDSGVFFGYGLSLTIRFCITGSRTKICSHRASFINIYFPTVVSALHCRDLVINNDHISQMEQKLRQAIDKVSISSICLIPLWLKPNLSIAYCFTFIFPSQISANLALFYRQLAHLCVGSGCEQSQQCDGEVLPHLCQPATQRPRGQ